MAKKKKKCDKEYKGMKEEEKKTSEILERANTWTACAMKYDWEK